MRAVFAVAAFTLLAGCAASSGQVQPSPQGIGSSPNQLRRAPCACMELKNLPDLPAHLNSSAAGAMAHA